jgi:hypothetical protein
MARIPYADKETLSEEDRSYYEAMEKAYGGSLPSIYKVMIHSPKGMEVVRAFYNQALPTWKLDSRLHALAHIKSSQLHDCTY